MKKSAHTLNMTDGSIISLLIRFSIPMLIGNIFQQVYNLVDSVIVGRFVNADALASIGATSSVTFLFFALCNGIGSGGGIIVSQFFGSNDTAKVKRCISNTAYIMIAFPAIVGITAFFLSEPILNLLGTPKSLMMDAISYIRTMCVGIVFVSGYNFISSMLRALGDSKTPLYFLIFSCILNAILDFLFVYFFDMGVFGAGVATVISQFISGLGSIIYAVSRNPYFKLSKSDFKIDTKIMKQTIKLGVPLSLQFSLIAISCMALQKVVNSYGETAVAAFTATSRIEQIIHQPYGTLGAALATFTGQNYGARKLDRVYEGYRKGMFLMIVFSAVMCPLMIIFGRGITSVFVEETSVIEMGAMALNITSPFYFFLGMIYVIRGVQNGFGDGLFALINGFVEVFGRFFVPVFMTSIAFVGVWGIWWSVGVVWTISAITTWFRYVYYKKKKLPKLMKEST